MLTTVVLVLQECLEASLIIGLLLILQKKLAFYPARLATVFLLSLVFTLLFSAFYRTISEWFDGSGQEVVNGALLSLVSLFLAIHITTTHHQFRYPRPLPPSGIPSFISWILSLSALVIIVFSVMREGSEIIVYLRGALLNPHQEMTSVAVGTIIGAGLGICIGILVYFALGALSLRKLILISTALTMFIAAGLMAEAIQNFIQANWILADFPIWDTSSYLPENSLAGQLLHAIFAYEATPTREEVFSWLTTILVISISIIFIRLCPPTR